MSKENTPLTTEQEFEKFTGQVSVHDGNELTNDNEDLNPVSGKNTTPAEDAALADRTAARTAATKGAPKEAAKEPVALTEAEEDAAIVAAEKVAGKELDDAEIVAALAAATDKKNGAAAKVEQQKSPRSARARIKQAVDQKNKERSRADAEKARADRAEAALAAKGKDTPLTTDVKSAKADDDKEPKPEDFEFGELDAKYIRALARYETRQELAADRAIQDKSKVTVAEAKAIAEFKEAKATFEKAGGAQFEDFEEVVMQGARDEVWPLSETLGSLLFDSEHGPAIAYELASNPEEATRVNKLSNAKQAAWFGKREAEVSAGSGDSLEGKAATEAAAKTLKTKVSKAPAPIERARGNGSTSVSDGADTDFAAFEASARQANQR